MFCINQSNISIGLHDYVCMYVDLDSEAVALICGVSGGLGLGEAPPLRHLFACPSLLLLSDSCSLLL